MAFFSCGGAKRPINREGQAFPWPLRTSLSLTRPWWAPLWSWRPRCRGGGGGWCPGWPVGRPDSPVPCVASPQRLCSRPPLGRWPPLLLDRLPADWGKASRSPPSSTSVGSEISELFICFHTIERKGIFVSLQAHFIWSMLFDTCPCWADCPQTGVGWATHSWARLLWAAIWEIIRNYVALHV